jgi:D-threo-aldose 1-dehydrogenase
MDLTPRPFGEMEFTVSPICIGCAPLGSMPEVLGYAVDEEQALTTIRAIFATSQINFIDTAAAYGDGESERRIGIVLREIGGVPPSFLVATKADRDMQTGDFSGAQMRRSVERSLRLLGLDYLPFCYLHDPEIIGFEAAMAPGGPVDVLRQCQAEGLIRHLGIAGGPLDMMTQFVETDIFEAAISHNRYTLLTREADAFWDICQQHSVAALNAAPYNSGILVKGPGNNPRYMYHQATEDELQRAFAVEAICQRYGIPLAAAALQFSMRDPRITSTIVGMSRPERIAATIAFAEYPIPDAFWDELPIF